MKVTAVLLHYYPERTENIARIVKDLRANSRPPNEIVIFNNNPEITYPTSKGLTVINSSKNYGGRGRYPIAFLEPSDYYYFLDDDVTVHKDTLTNFLKYAREGCCYGYWGKIVNPKFSDLYQKGNEFYGRYIKSPKEVDLLVGEGTFFVSHIALERMFKTERMLLKEGYEFGREEDLILSMSNRPFVIPADKSEQHTQLPKGGVAYCKQPDHWRLRNEATRRLYPTRRLASSISVSDRLNVKIEEKEVKKENGYKPI